MKRILYIERLVFAILLLLLSGLIPVRAQIVVFTGNVTTLAVKDQGNGETYNWDLYDNGIGDFATKTDYCPTTSADFVGDNKKASVDIKWMKAGFYFFKVTSYNITGCTSNFKIGIIEVKIAVKADITPPDTAGVCLDKPVLLEVNLTGTAPWSFTCTDGVNSWSVTNVMTSPYTITIDPTPATTTQYWISTVSDKFGTNTEPSEKVTQRINPLPDPSNIIHR
jgi:hypothetical protein